MAEALGLTTPEPASTHVEVERLRAAQSGDRRAFDELIRPIRGRLRQHCYRMLGTIDEADDAVQETLLRAWRHLGGFDPRASVLAWLYRIATNVCLTTLGRREIRGPSAELLLQPFPDHPTSELDRGDPSASAERLESVQLAFTATVLALPARQRAALLLREVLGFSAVEVAEMLDTSVAAANSALQRARATLREPSLAPLVLEHKPGAPQVERLLVRRFMTAWENADVDGLVELLTHDALLAMPPEPERFVGRDAVRSFLRQGPLRHPGRFLLAPTRANGQPAMATYLRTRVDGVYEAHAVIVLSLRGNAISSITRFVGAPLVGHFGFPAWADRAPRGPMSSGPGAG